MNHSWGKIFSKRSSRGSGRGGRPRRDGWHRRTCWSGSRAAGAVAGRCSSSVPGNSTKRQYRYYACAKRAEDRSCAQPYIPASRLEGAVIGKLQELADRPARIKPFLTREIKRQKANRRNCKRHVQGLERQITDLEARQDQLVNWLADTLPRKAAARS